jgi:hypothetical protein
MHVPNQTLLIEDEDRRMSNTAVFCGVDYSVLSDGLLVRVRKDWEFCAGGLGHRPCIRLLVHAYRDQFSACLFKLVIVLSQPGELLRARASPKASIEDEHYRRTLRIV